MSPEVKYCFEDEDVAHVAENMAELQVRRLPVMNHDNRLVGIVSLADLAIEGSLPKTARRFTAFRNRAANTTRVGRVLNNHMVLGRALRANSLPGSTPQAPGHAVAQDHALLPSRDGRFVGRARRA